MYAYPSSNVWTLNSKLNSVSGSSPGHVPQYNLSTPQVFSEAADLLPQMSSGHSVFRMFHVQPQPVVVPTTENIMHAG